MKDQQRGGTLIEVVMATGMLALLITVFFLILDLSIRSFQSAIVRHNIQADTQRISYRLSEDLKRSHYFTISRLLLRSSGDLFDRHAICIGAVKDWSAADAINNQDGRPNWNGYILYYLPVESGDEPVQRLYRCWISPPATQVGQFAFPALSSTTHCPIDPKTSSNIESFSLLSNIVEMFRVEEAENSQWRVSFRLRQRAAKKRGSRTMDEVLETTVQVRPENTFPIYY